MDIEALARSRELSKQVSKELEEAINEAEKTQTIRVETTFQSVINQPSLIGISSTSAIQPTAITSSVAETSFNSFTINLPRPALNVKSLQLLSMNAPQAQVNIPDNALCFWYYRLQTQNFQWQVWDSETTYQVNDNVSISDANFNIFNSWRANNINTNSPPTLDNPDWIKTSTFKYVSPNIFNLHCVRLLPSYYKDDLIPTGQIYGYNRTFTSYEDLATELLKATTTADLSLVNGSSPFLQNITDESEYTPATIPNDISITYNATKNKFICTGLRTNTKDEYVFIPLWNETTLYPVQSLVRYTPEGQEEQIYVNWSPEQTYPPDNALPVTSWAVYVYNNSTVWNTYLLAGYNDPNVIKMQGDATRLDWNADNLFQPNSKAIYYKGLSWTNSLLSINQPPPDGVWLPTVYYNAGDIVYLVSGDPPGVHYCVIPNINQNPGGGGDYWVELPSWQNPWSPDNGVLTGMNYISKNFDFKQVYDPTRALGIPPQPYTQNLNQLQLIINNQTLNRILGFTWNGVNMIIPFTKLPDINDNLQFGSLLTLFYNRLRPVPTYAYAIPSIALLGAYSETPIISTNSYTADSFCNLVYSSTITIYTRILGGSTTDTVRNTNLLAIMPLNC